MCPLWHIHFLVGCCVMASHTHTLCDQEVKMILFKIYQTSRRAVHHLRRTSDLQEAVENFNDIEIEFLKLIRGELE